MKRFAHHFYDRVRSAHISFEAAPDAPETNRANPAGVSSLPPDHAPFLILDGDGLIRRMSAAARALLAPEEDNLVPESFFSLVHRNNLYGVMRDVVDMVCYGKKQVDWLLQLSTGRSGWATFAILACNQLEHDSSGLLLLLQAA